MFDKLEQEAQTVDEILQLPGFTHKIPVNKDEPITAHTDIIIEPVSKHTVINRSCDFTKQLKADSFIRHIICS